MRDKTTVIYLEVAIMSALGIVFDIIGYFLGSAAWVQGGSIGITMLAIFIMAYRRGLLYGLLTGLIIGLLQIIYEGSVNPFQAFLDYILGYASVGLAGIFYFLIRKKTWLALVFMPLGAFIGSAFRFAASLVSGRLYYVPTWGESFAYNIGYMVPSFILTASLLIIIYLIQPAIIIPELRSE